MFAAIADYFDLNKLMGMLPNSSEHGKEIDSMLNFCHWFMLILFVGWTTYFLYCMWRFNASRNPKADHHGVRSHLSTHIEASVVIIEAVILLGFGIPLWGKRVNEVAEKDKSDALRIRAIGYQFGWHIHYAGPDGVFGRQSTRFIEPGRNPLGIDPNDENGRDDAVTSEMHLQKGKATVVRVSSMDVIHGFALHQMRVQQDATPGTEAPMWFRPVKTGQWQIICAQLCGDGHSGMAASYSCEEEKDFTEWYAGQRELFQGKLQAQAAEMKAKAEKEAASQGEKKAAH